MEPRGWTRDPAPDDIRRFLVLQFLESRNWPEGAARAVVLILIMLVSVIFYLWFANRGRKTREVSVI